MVRSKAHLCRVTASLLMANTGSLGSHDASPAFVVVQALVAHGVRVAPYVRFGQPQPVG